VCGPVQFKVPFLESGVGPGDLQTAITLIVADATNRLVADAPPQRFWRRWQVRLALTPELLDRLQPCPLPRASENYGVPTPYRSSGCGRT
jgi:hypothetical protein